MAIGMIMAGIILGGGRGGNREGLGERRGIWGCDAAVMAYDAFMKAGRAARTCHRRARDARIDGHSSDCN